MANEAFRLARCEGRLAEGADVMEEAFNRWPALRDENEYWGPSLAKGNRRLKRVGENGPCRSLYPMWRS